MKTATVTVLNKSGLHARWAAELVKLTSSFISSIEISKDGSVVDGKSIMGILTLAAGHLTQLVINVSGVDEDESLRVIMSFFENLSCESEKEEAY